MSHVKTRPLAPQTLRERNVLVRYFPGPATGDHLRITIGTDVQMDTFLAALTGVA
jgi:histidinol-phosphate/aromatic aminotransferase/cobyric acid decarboxylase-like protein